MLAVNGAINIGHAIEILFGEIVLPGFAGDIAQFVERGSDAGMSLAEGAFLDSEGWLEEVGGVVIAFLINERAGEYRQIDRSLGIVLAVPALHDVERLAIVLLGFGVMTQVVADGAEINVNVGDERVTIAINFLIHFENALIEDRGDFVMTGVEMGVGQLVQAVSGIRRRGIWRGVEADGLFEHGDGLIVGAAIGKDGAEGEHGFGDGGIVGRKVTFIDVQRLADEAFGFFVLGLVVTQGTEREQAFRGLDAIGAENCLASVQGGLQERIGPIVFAQFLINAAKSFKKLGLDRGFGIEAAAFLHTTIEQGDDAEIVGRRGGGIATLKKIQHKMLDALGTLSLCEGGVSRSSEPDRVKNHECEKDCDDRSGRGKSTPVAADKFADGVAQGIWLSIERLAF